MITKPAVVDLTVNSTTVHAGKCYLFGAYVTATVSEDGPVLIKNGATTIVSIDADTPAHTHFTFPGIEFATSLVVDPHDSATGTIVIAYRPSGWAGNE